MTTGAETETQNSIITNGTTADAPADPTNTSTDLSTQSNPVNKSKCINSRKLWSFEEDQKLLGSLATTKDYSYISREVFKNSRSVHSVRHRAIALMNQTQSVDFNEYLTVPLINDHLMTSDIVQFQQIVQPPLEPPVSFRWTPSEDQMLLAFIAMHGKKYTWASRCLFNGKRSPDACRFRQDTKSINYLKQGFSYQVRGDICVDLEYIVVPRRFHDVFLLLNMSDETNDNEIIMGSNEAIPEEIMQENFGSLRVETVRDIESIEQVSDIKSMEDPISPESIASIRSQDNDALLKDFDKGMKNPATESLMETGSAQTLKETKDAPRAEPSLKQTGSVIPKPVVIDQTGEVDEKKLIEELEALVSRVFNEKESDLVIQKPEYDTKKLLEAEAKLYYSPADPVPGHSNTIEDILREQRDLEEDGFYVDSVPKSNWDSWLRMERRLKRETNGGSKWFGVDGRMITVPDVIVNTSKIEPLKNTELHVNELGRTVDKCASVYHKPYILNETDEHILVDDKFQLVFYFNDIKLKEHPLIIEETRKAIELTELVQKLNETKRSNVFEYLEGKLNALRSSYEEFKRKFPDETAFFDRQDEIQSALPSPVNTLRRKSLYVASLEERNSLYAMQKVQFLEQIKSLKQKYEEESRQMRLLEWKILKLWESLKEIRHKQKFTSSSVKIILNTTKTDEQEDRRKIQDYIDKDLEEKQELHDLQKRLMQQTLPGKTDNVQAQGDAETPVTPSTSRRRRRTMEDESKSVQETATDRRKSAISEMSVDSGSRSFNKERILKDILSNVESCFRPAGMPIIAIKIGHVESITPTSDCPQAEQLRRSQIESSLIVIRLFINKREVLRSEPASIQAQDFDISLKATELAEITVQFNEIPKEIKVEIFEKGPFIDTVIGEAVIPIPDVTREIRTIDQEISNIPFEGKEFKVSSAYDTYSKTGDSKSIKRTQSGDLRSYRGTVRVITVWDVDENDRTMAPNLRQVQKSKDNVPDNSMLDPNDLRNLNDTENISSDDLDSEKVTASENELSLEVNASKFNSKRFEVLRLRNDRSIKIQGPVPLFDDEIPETLLESKENYDDGSNATAETPPETIQLVSDFLGRIKKHELYKNIYNLPTMHLLSIHDVVREESLPEAAKENLLKFLFGQRRPLKPERRKRISKATARPEDCKIVCRILRGFNLPVRNTEFDGVSQADPTMKKDLGYVNTFVEVRFQNLKQRCAAVEGSSPQWNETISLPFNPPNGEFSPEVLSAINDSIHVNLYDEYTTEILQNRNGSEMESFERREKTLLGTATIAFSNLYKHTVIEGKLSLKVPDVLFGYEKSEKEKNSSGLSNDDAQVEVFISLEPVLEQPKSLQPKFVSDESEDVLQMAQRWIRRGLKDRPLKPLVLDMEGKTTLITRFIRPLNPPSGINSVEHTSRFVASIPFFEHALISAPGDLCCNSKQLLDIGAGNDIEHSILLCNYLLHLKRSAYVIIGKSSPEGQSAYVLVDELGQVNRAANPQSKLRGIAMINPLTGLSYSPADSNFSLTEIYFVFNQENAWANVQSALQPSKLNFVFTARSEWLPLLPPNKHKDLTSVQPDKLSYSEVPKKNIKDMERSIHGYLTDLIEKKRVKLGTKWNKSCSKVFEIALPVLEERKQGKKSSSLNAFFTELKKLQTVYKIKSFSLNKPFTCIEDVRDDVLNTDMFQSADQNTEFALAVHCYPYSNNVISLWVYVGVLTRIKR